MALTKDLLEKPANLASASKYTAINGFIYIGGGVLLIVWAGAVQTLFMDQAFAGYDAGLLRMGGLTLLVICWYCLFGGRSGAQQVVTASVFERIIFLSRRARASGDGRHFSASDGGVRNSRPVLAIGAREPLGRKL